ncbi:ABC transporter permease [Actinotalea sp.]|uniref:ABC transporter permease n=1 Tax=Actinotalea sp. TaxID=1872145 RepID=UPI0035616DD5
MGVLRRHPVVRFVLRRTAGTVVLLLGLSFIVFALLYLAPGDLTKNLLGNRRVSPEAIAAVREQYHLDDPFLLQYGRWLLATLQGDLGVSIRSGAGVGSMLVDRGGLTMALTLIAFALAVGLGVPLGVLAARRRNSAVDRGIVGAALVGVSAPSFAVGLLLLYAFAVMLGWFPLYGVGEGVLDRLWHLALPAAALAIGLGALVIKMTRTAVLAELEQDYVTFARARGLNGRTVSRLYLTNAAIPIVTSAGLMLAFLFGGTILVEVTFALPGIGSLLSESITFKDVPVVQAVTLLVALVIAGTSLLVDLAYLLLDPRVRRTGVGA